MSDFVEPASQYKMTLVCAKMLLCGRSLQYIFARSARFSTAELLSRQNFQSHMVAVRWRCAW